MIKKQLTGTDINGSKLVLGTDDFGSAVETERAFAVMDRYYEAEGNIFDTARVYADWLPGGSGASEGCLGSWIKEKRNRHDVIISTKCSHPPIHDMSKSRLSLEDMLYDNEQSLTLLQTDYIDILWLHRDDESMPVEDIAENLYQLSKRDTVRYFGVSNWKADRIKALKNLNAVKMIGSQIKWSYGATNPAYEDDPTLVEMDDIQLEYYKNSDINIFAFASQAKGFFSKYASGGEAKLSQKSAQRYLWDENLKRYQRAREVASKYNLPISAVILGYITSREDINGYPIVGAKHISQIE
ncbi:MAG: aldo/keto reductase, partial [Eubacteriales bacterium]|nr:aldo/keto reductase [Eubacteriales bacterium]